MSLPSVIQTTGVVVDSTKIQISANIPEKERIRYVYTDLPPGTQISVELYYSVDNYHGKEFHDYLFRRLKVIPKS